MPQGDRQEAPKAPSVFASRRPVRTWRENQVARSRERGTMDKEPTTDSRKTSRRPKWMVPITAVAVVVVLAVAGIVGWSLDEPRRHDSAVASCVASVKSMYDSSRTAQATVDQYQEAAAIRAPQVQNPKTVSNIRKIGNTIKRTSGTRLQNVQCDAAMSTAELRDATDTARRYDTRLNELSSQYTEAAKAVVASQDAKSLQHAKDTLDRRKGEALSLLVDSDGKVTDGAVRDGLQAAIEQAGQAKGNKPDAYLEAAASLQAAIDQVNASVQAQTPAGQ